MEQHSVQPRKKSSKDKGKKASDLHETSSDVIASTSSKGGRTTLGDFINLLEYNLVDSELDVQACLLWGQNMTVEEKGRSDQAARSQQFKSFLSDNKLSQALLINGNVKEPTRNSFFSPLIANHSLKWAANDKVFFWTYFCGRHTQQNVSSLMTTIIHQLLSIPCIKYDLSIGVKDKEIKEHSCETLCVTFLALMYQLPESMTIFCCIDSISAYETEEKAKDTVFVVGTLAGYIRRWNPNTDAVFKLLFTEPGRSQRAWRYIHKENIMDLHL